jgi:GT2 family glycosyltransferase
MKPILAILILYRMQLVDSPTYRTLRAALDADPAIGEALTLVVADNSPEAQAMPEGFAGRYIHDGGNLGLAQRYNEALALAEAEGSPWLLTLDQDTTLTLAYLQELLQLSRTLGDRKDIAIIAPKLATVGRILSPEPPTFDGGEKRVPSDATGVLGANLFAYNSASLVRVSALRSIGGYPARYWLDYLDHATFRILQRAGWRVYVMCAVLEHDLSQESPESRSLTRTWNILTAEARFYREYGTRQERFWHRIALLRQMIGHGRRGRLTEAKQRWEILRGHE